MTHKYWLSSRISLHRNEVRALFSRFSPLFFPGFHALQISAGQRAQSTSKFWTWASSLGSVLVIKCILYRPFGPSNSASLGWSDLHLVSNWLLLPLDCSPWPTLRVLLKSMHWILCALHTVVINLSLGEEFIFSWEFLWKRYLVFMSSSSQRGAEAQSSSVFVDHILHGRGRLVMLFGFQLFFKSHVWVLVTWQ